MEIIQTIKKLTKGKPKLIFDKQRIVTEISLGLKNKNVKFAHIRTEIKDYGHIYKMTLYIDQLAFKEWIINKETKLITKTLDHFS